MSFLVVCHDVALLVEWRAAAGRTHKSRSATAIGGMFVSWPRSAAGTKRGPGPKSIAFRSVGQASPELSRKCVCSRSARSQTAPSIRGRRRCAAQGSRFFCSSRGCRPACVPSMRVAWTNSKALRGPSSGRMPPRPGGETASDRLSGHACRGLLAGRDDSRRRNGCRLRHAVGRHAVAVAIGRPGGVGAGSVGGDRVPGGRRAQGAGRRRKKRRCWMRAIRTCAPFITLRGAFPPPTGAIAPPLCFDALSTRLRDAGVVNDRSCAAPH